jgi:hypothetical protein
VKFVTMPKLPPPPQPPEQLRVLLCIGHQKLAVGGDQITTAEPVDGQPELAHEMTEASTECEAADSGVADDPAGGCQPEGLGLPVEMRIQASAFKLDGARQRIHTRPRHGREVDHDTAVIYGVPGDGVPATAHGRRQVALSTEAHRGHHVGDPPAPSKQRRPSLYVPVPDLPGRVEARVLPSDQLAREVGGQCLDARPVDCDHQAPPHVLASMVRATAADE